MTELIPVDIDLEGIVVIVGNYGSGKTETAVNLAVNRRRSGLDVRIADLDLVNPYFRTREAKSALEALGVKVILPPSEYMQADLPILSPLVKGLIKNPGELAILDAGGDHVGATVLAALGDVLGDGNSRMIQVVNPFRPFTETIEGCLRMRDEIEASSRLKIKGIAGNANLIDQTGADDIYRGYDFVSELSEESGLPLIFITASAELIPELDTARFSCPVLPIERQLVPPWRRAALLGPDNFKIHDSTIGDRPKQR